MKGRLKDLTIGLNGEQNITVTVRDDFRQEFQKLREDAVDVAIKKHRELRSKDANAYFWLIVSKIGECMTPPQNKDDVYFLMLKRYGQGGMVSIEDRFQSDFLRSYKYVEEAGEAELNGKHFTHYRFWVGSSEYNTLEMSRLIDGIVGEAQDLGIDTDTPETIARYKEQWGAGVGNQK